MLVKDVMRDAVCIKPDEALDAAAHKLKEHDVGCLVVRDAVDILGIVTDRDVLMRSTAVRRNCTQVKVRDAMSVEVLCCSEADSTAQAEAKAKAHHVHRLPVLDGDGGLVGLFSLDELDGEGSRTVPFEVVFYKDVPDDHGHLHHVERKRIFVGPDRTKEQAIATAIGRLEQEEQCTWNSWADGYEVVESHGSSIERPE